MNKLSKALLFVRLYVFATYKYLTGRMRNKPQGIQGEQLFMFFDPHYPSQKHSVIVFALPKRVSAEGFSTDLWGPFGYTSQIDLNGVHLYGRDTWGTVEKYQIFANPTLQELKRKYPDNTFLLAGVRSFFGFHPWPLRASKFILVRKKV